ncbi:MAG: chloride channel protein [Caldilineaceae bacterium]
MSKQERIEMAAGSARPETTLPFSLANLLVRWQIPEELIIVTTALFVGLGTGLGAVAFIWMLARINDVVSVAKANLGEIPGLLLMMAIAGLIVGAMIERWAREAKGHGVPEVMEAVAMRGGRIRPRVALVKVLASSITIGSGGSAGREGPIVQVGSTLGSTVGQMLRFSDERVQMLVACGAAAGIAATFNAPIAGTIFAMEVILANFTVRYFGAVVISSVTAGIVSRVLLSDQPAFTVPSYPLHHLAELPIYVVLGILAAFVAILFIRLLYYAEHVFDGWKMPLAIKAAVGMILTALVALLLPGRDVLGPGLHAIGEAIANNFDVSLGMLFALLVLKMLATTFTLGSGNSGGVFAPSLFMGAILGGIVGTVAHGLWPDIALNPGAYAIVGMAAVFAGAARAPITAVIIVFEMSGDYKLILPLMLATVLSTLLAELLFKESIYTLKLKLKGITLERGRDVDLMQSVTVSEVMQRDVSTVSTGATLVELSDRFAQTHSHGFIVVDDEAKIWGIVTVTDLDQAVAEGLPRRTTADQIGTPRAQLLVAHPDEPIGNALARMGVRGIGRLPVVRREDPEHVIGMIRRQDIIRAYDMARSRRAELEHRAKRAKLQNLDDTEFVELALSAEDQAVGKTIQDMGPQLPHDCILVRIRRQGVMMIPHGNTVFQSGDDVTAFIRSQDFEAVYKTLKGQKVENQHSA